MPASIKTSLARRNFLKTSVFSAFTGWFSPQSSGGGGAPQNAESAAKTRLNYPDVVAGSVLRLRESGSLAFTYPDKKSPCLLIKMKEPCDRGIGPEQDIVAFSILCSHQGCPVAYDARTQVFRCPCHFSQFDGERDGQMICGQATRKLARIELRWDEKSDNIIATGVDGLIYGRQANVI